MPTAGVVCLVIMDVSGHSELEKEVEDVKLLQESLEYQEDDPSQQRQALRALSEILCQNSKLKLAYFLVFYLTSSQLLFFLPPKSKVLDKYRELGMEDVRRYMRLNLIVCSFEWGFQVNCHCIACMLKTQDATLRNTVNLIICLQYSNCSFVLKYILNCTLVNDKYNEGIQNVNFCGLASQLQ